MNIKKFENYMSREEMCQSICRCGYNMSELEECSNQELEEMCRNEEEENNSHNHNMTQEAKGEKWIQDAIKNPGALKKSMGKKEGDKQKKAALNIYLQVLNLLNTRNIQNVYNYTGNASDDGYLSDPSGQQATNSNVSPQGFTDQYRIFLNSPGNYSRPRTIRIGVMLDF